MKSLPCRSDSECQHEAPPFPKPGRSGFIERDAGPLPRAVEPGFESIVPCIHCGAPLNRGRYAGLFIDPEWAREKGIPTDRYPNPWEDT